MSKLKLFVVVVLGRGGKASLELVILLSLSLECWDSRPIPQGKNTEADGTCFCLVIITF